MNKIPKNQKGFGAVEAILILVIIILIGVIGWLVYKNHHKSTTTKNTATTSSSKPKSTTSSTSNNPYAGWNTYTSKLGGFTLKYPASWNITGFQGYNPVDKNQFTGNESELYISKYPETTTQNNFGVTVNVNAQAPTATPYNDYPNGTTKVLPNGITLWQEKQNINDANGPTTVSCPTMNIGTDDTYSMKLANGKYLSISGSFCWAQRMTSSDTYQEQINSSAWADAVNIIKSVTF